MIFFKRKQLFFLGFLIPWIIFSCDLSIPPKQEGESDFQNVTKRGLLENSEIAEASGISFSIRNPGNLWIINDSGKEPQNKIFLIDSMGKGTTEFILKDIRNYDFEAIACFKNSGGIPEIILGDIGDNFTNRSQVYPLRIYWFSEPLWGSTSSIIPAVNSIEVNLPNNESINFEALLVDQETKDIFILSKSEPNKKLFKIAGSELVNGRKILATPMPEPNLDKPFSTAEEVINFYSVTDAGVSPDNQEILIRTYGNVYYWKRKPGETIDQAITRQARVVPSFSKYAILGSNSEGEPQGEGVSFDSFGKGYYTISEQAPTQLYYFSKK